MLTTEHTLLELEAHTVLSQHFRKQLTFHLFDKLIDCISESEVAFVSRMGMQIQIHEQSFLFCIMLEQFFYGEA